MPKQPILTVDDLYPRSWIKPEDLQGRRLTLKISAAEVREIGQAGGGTVERLVLVFEHTGNRSGRVARNLIANKTQTLRLAEIIGSKAFADWPGHTISLLPAKTRNGHATIVLLAADAPSSVGGTEPAAQIEPVAQDPDAKGEA